MERGGDSCNSGRYIHTPERKKIATVAIPLEWDAVTSKD